VRWQKLHSLASFGLSIGSWGLPMCAMRVGYSYFHQVFQYARSFFSMAHNGWRYEKLPISGDFLSIYTKAEAGYNP
jgi:hypothetical protein